MAESTNSRPSDSEAFTQRLEQIIQRFEAAWQRGEQPLIEDHLPADAALRRSALVELVHADLEIRLKAGESARIENYLERYPDLADQEVLVQLIRAEYSLRNRRESGLGLDEYQRRFPQVSGLVMLTPTLGDGAKVQVEAVASEARHSRHPFAGPVTHLRCPHCHNPIELLDDRCDEVLCPGCGSPFRIRDARQSASALPLKPLGKFELLERVGVGAFGTVWRAHDTQLDRIVALKIPHAGLLTEEEYRERFRREARTAAQLRHPNIVSVHEVQTLDGLPTLVEDFIQGVPLSDLTKVRRLTFREAAGLVADVANALHYAHEMGVIHRDIKPANIMVVNATTAEGPAAENGHPATQALRPLIMDFGLALRDEAEITITLDGHIIGTPAYMSPEQAAGKAHQVDRRSDVYSLGVIFYELLAGELPFRGSRTMLIEQTLHEEPRPPRKINDKIPRDLETICLHCLHKEPSKRYATAQDLAEDLNRFLRGEAVRARPVGPFARAWRWCKRNPYLAGTTASAATGLVAATVVAMVLAISQAKHAAELGRAAEDLQQEEQQTRSALADAEGQRAKAEQNAQEAQARERETRAVLNFVEDKVFKAARPKDREGGLGYDVTLADALQKALPHVENAFKDQPLIEARLRMTMGASFAFLGHAKIAVEQYEAARILFAKHKGPHHPDTLLSMNHLAQIYLTLSKYGESLKLFEETLKLQKAELGPEHPSTLMTMNNLAAAYNVLGRYAESLKLNEEVLPLLKSKLGPDHPGTLDSMYNLASSYHALGRYLEAIKLRKEILGLRRVKLGPDHLETLVAMDSLATSYAALGHHVEALRLREEIVPLLRAKLGPDHPGTLTMMSNLAGCYVELGRYTDALQLCNRILLSAKAKLGPDHRVTLDIMNNLAVSYFTLGRYADALKLWEETLVLQKAKLGPDHPDTLKTMHNMASNYFETGRYADAVKTQEEALRLRKVKLGPDNPEILVTMQSLGASYGQLGRYTDARKLFEEALLLAKAKLGPDHPHTLNIMSNLAASYLSLGRYADALKLGEEASVLQKAKLGPDHPDTLATMSTLANTYEALGRHGDALKLREETRSLLQSKLGPDHPDTLASTMSLAVSYNQLRRYSDAVRLLEETVRLSRTKLGRDHPRTLGSMHNLADSYMALGRNTDALKLFEETLSLQKASLGADHPQTLMLQNDIANCLSGLDRHEEALTLREEMFAFFKAKLGPNHPDTLRAMGNLALNLAQLDRGTEAVVKIDDFLSQAAGKPVNLNIVTHLLEWRLRHFAKANDAGGCRKTAEMCEQLKRVDPDSLYNAACYRAVTAAVLRAADKSGKDAKAVTAEADQAMAWLQQGVAAGYKDIANMKKDKDLDVLRSRDDFQKLVAELENKQRPTR